MEKGFSLIELFKLGGPFMWVLLAFSVATIAIVIERCIYLAWHNCKVAPLRNKIMDYLQQGKKEEAEEFLASCTHKQTVASVLLALLQNAKYGESRMERAAESEAQERLRRMENGFNYLTALSSLAPLAGFLGTVSGMIGAFKRPAGCRRYLRGLDYDCFRSDYRNRRPRRLQPPDSENRQVCGRDFKGNQ